MDGVEAVQRERQRVGLVELEGVPRLRLDIHAHHLEPGAVVAHARSTGTAEEVEQSGLAHGHRGRRFEGQALGGHSGSDPASQSEHPPPMHSFDSE